MNRIMKVEDQLPATTQYDDPWAEIAAELGTPTLLSYTKGVWDIKEEPVPLGTEFVCFIDQLRRGYIKFNEEGPPDLVITKVTDRKVKRHECGDVDEEAWDTDPATGEPKDPWQATMQLPMSPVERIGEMVVFSAISGGALSAVANLCDTYHNARRKMVLPIVALGTSSYKHKKYSTVHVPVLKLVRWHQTAPDLVESENPAPADFNGFNLDDE
jgi:hypothetical protein